MKKKQLLLSFHEGREDCINNASPCTICDDKNNELVWSFMLFSTNDCSNYGCTS